MTLAATAVGAAGSIFQGVSSANQMKAEAKAEQQRAEIEGQWNQRRSLEERAAAQSEASAASREARLAQSRLGSIAAASGSSASDPTVMGLWKGIEGEGRHNAAMATAAGEQRAAGLDYQTSLSRWSADTNARIKKAAARNTIIGSVFDAGSQIMKSPMGARYGGAAPSYGSTGYGR